MTPGRALHRTGRLLMQGSSVALALCGIVLLWVGLLHTLSVERSAAMEGAASATANLSRAFEEQILGSIKAVDQSLMFVRENFARDPTTFDIAAWARSAEAVTDVAIQLSMTDARGMMQATSMDPNAVALDLSDREHIRVHMGTTEDKLFISKPLIGRVSHRWSIQFSRKLFKADGSFAGVVVLSLDPTYLTRFYQSIDLGEHGAITLIGTDGVIRAAARDRKSPDTDPAVGRWVGAELLLEHGDEARKAQVGPIDFDGIRRITSYRRVSIYPLTVAVGFDENDVLTNYWRARRNYYLVAGTLTAVLLVVAVLVLLHQRRLSRAQESLRDSRALYAENSQLLETALEHMGQGILMVDGQRRIQVCNRHAVEMLGLPPALLTRNTRFDELLRWQWSNHEFGAHGDALDDSLRQFILSGGISPEPQSYERTRPTGMVLDIRSTPLPDGGVVRTYTDVTQRKRTEQDLRFARDQADSATRAKSEFLATMSHEIRSPLSGLLGLLDLLRQTPLDANQAHMTSLAHGSALTLLSILNDILDFSKIEAGAVMLTLEPVDCRRMIDDVSQPNAMVAAEKGVALHVHFEPDLPAVICTDQRRTGQILNNLISNAVKFTVHGSIDVIVGRDGTRFRFEVHDSGCGMDQATLARLFQPFTQADGSSSRNAGGTGLGLCISRRLAEMMDGTITVTSEPGRGSCFTLTLPCMAASAILPVTVKPAQEPATPAVGLRTLLVDDDPTNQWLTKRQLEMLGAVVDAASSGEVALARLRTGDYDLLVTDCHMPGMDGVALTNAVRASAEAWRTLPVIGLTADVTPEQARRCREAGMTEIAYKPLNRDALAQLLAEHTTAAITQDGTVESTQGTVVLDRTAFRDLFDDCDPDGAEWLEAYCQTAVSRTASLRELIAAAPLDAPAIVAVAHSLVGSSLSVGANRLAAAARALEHAATAGSDRIAPLFAALEAEAALALDAIGRMAADAAVAADV